MSRYDPKLRWIDEQRERMISLVSAWASINSGSQNLAGLSRLSAELRREFAVLGGDITEVALRPQISVDATGRTIETPLAPALVIRKRPDAPRRGFLGIHMDTVYGPE